MANAAVLSSTGQHLYDARVQQLERTRWFVAADARPALGSVVTLRIDAPRPYQLCGEVLRIVSSDEASAFGGSAGYELMVRATTRTDTRESLSPASG